MLPGTQLGDLWKHRLGEGQLRIVEGVITRDRQGVMSAPACASLVLILFATILILAGFTDSHLVFACVPPLLSPLFLYGALPIGSVDQLSSHQV